MAQGGAVGIRWHGKIIWRDEEDEEVWYYTAGLRFVWTEWLWNRGIRCE